MSEPDWLTVHPWQQPTWQNWQRQLPQVGHAYLLAGQAGTGLSGLAHRMMQSLLCQASDGSAPCEQCAGCHALAQQTHPDALFLQPPEDKTVIPIDAVRAFSDKVYTTSHQGGRKVGLIAPAEALSESAFNALLKTLEEPPPGTILILLTHAPSRLPATLISRCRLWTVPMPTRKEALDWLGQACPQADDPLLKKALLVNWGAPLEAQRWIDEKGFEFEAQWQSDLKALQQNQQTVTQRVEAWLKQSEPQRVLDYFYLWTLQRIRGACYQQKWPLDPNWFAFQKAVLQAREYWHSNVNQALLLEALTHEWLAHLTPGYVPHEALKGRLIRGQAI
ncbi:DNA-directed DNA polymerase [Thiomicrospira sp. WB1]|uniref:DNA-directed DNA polymerase n=1 Tax=Thiomicrospira sp. WB1 TaxID=1685380 RepID=UPI00074807A1|nr:DNA-directed DNA polymerase [Thiomicrospira sp. WB1]KUJ72760.1 DNA-directed DNA polymerase [Thiomicrospira sp. WB1]